MEDKQTQAQVSPQNGQSTEPTNWVISNEAVKVLFNGLTRLPWFQVNEILTFLQKELRELPNPVAQIQKASETASGKQPQGIGGYPDTPSKQ